MMRNHTGMERMMRLLMPLMIYVLIGMLATGVSRGGYDLRINLLEKLTCACCMGYLFIRDSKTILWKKSRFSPAVWITAAAAGAGLCIGINELLVVTGLTGLLSQEHQAVTEVLYRQDIWLEILVLAVAAPLGEELLFRGILFRRMRTYCSYLPAAIITSLIFAVFHGNILQGVYGFAAGMLFSYVYECMHTVWAPVFVHAVSNAVSLLATETDICRRLLAAYPFFSMLAGCLILAASVFVITILLKKEQGENTRIS